MVDVRRVIAAKPEATYGTDSIPTLADDAIVTRNYSIVPLEVDQLQRNLDNRANLSINSCPGTEGLPTNGSSGGGGRPCGLVGQLDR